MTDPRNVPGRDYERGNCETCRYWFAGSPRMPARLGWRLVEWTEDGETRQEVESCPFLACPWREPDAERVTQPGDDCPECAFPTENPPRPGWRLVEVFGTGGDEATCYQPIRCTEPTCPRREYEGERSAGSVTEADRARMRAIGHFMRTREEDDYAALMAEFDSVPERCRSMLVSAPCAVCGFGFAALPLVQQARPGWQVIDRTEAGGDVYQRAERCPVAECPHREDDE